MRECFSYETKKRKLSLYTKVLRTIIMYKVLYIEDLCLFQDIGETALHLAILREMGSSLHIVDFLVQNMPTGGIDRTTIDGETALHLSARHDRAEAMKLLLRAGADPSYRNKQDKTPLDIAQEMGHHTCKELVI